MASRTSAGILLYHGRGPSLEVLLGHPGGPFSMARDEGHWTIPKGEIEPDEELLAVGLREFAEETGHRLPDGPRAPLGTIRQKGGKLVHAWAVEGELDPAQARSNTFRMEWPPRSGRVEEFPEIDRVAWFTIEHARIRMKDTQAAFLDRLLEVLADRPD